MRPRQSQGRCRHSRSRSRVLPPAESQASPAAAGRLLEEAEEAHSLSSSAIPATRAIQGLPGAAQGRLREGPPRTPHTSRSRAEGLPAEGRPLRTGAAVITAPVPNLRRTSTRLLRR